jgi:hypothetical protein
MVPFFLYRKALIAATCRPAVGILPLLLSFFTGCGNNISVTKVTGKITLNEVAVEDATVTFIPVSSSTKKSVATTTTDKNGSYVLKTYMGDKTANGAFPGEYKVTVVKRVQTDFPDLNLKNLTPEPGEDHPVYDQGRYPRHFRRVRYQRGFLEYDTLRCFHTGHRAYAFFRERDADDGLLGEVSCSS